VLDASPVNSLVGRFSTRVEFKQQEYGQTQILGNAAFDLPENYTVKGDAVI
jgi:hypothetical protein